MPSYWPYKLQPRPSECLTSWLCRNAKYSGLNPYRFCQRILPNQPIWSRDVDRNPSDDFLGQLQAVSGIDAKILCAMTLRPFVDRLHVEAYGNRNGYAISPLVLSIGIYGRFRMRKGMQYCRECLVQDRAFKTIWRFAFLTHCEKHGCVLHDSCSFCGTTILLHKSSDIIFCAVCGKKLYEVSSRERVMRITRLELSERMLHATSHCRVPVFGGEISSFCFLKALRNLISMLIDVEVFEKDTALARCERKTFEFMSVYERHSVLEIIEALLRDWPNNFREYASFNNLTQRRFVRYSWPDVIRREIELLPEGKVVTREYCPLIYCPSLRSLKKRNIHRYRITRAGLLLNEN
jgi:hypothetical protein